MLCTSFPPPDRTVLGIDDRTDVHEATFRKHARGGIRLGPRMRPDGLHTRIVAGEVNQRARGLGGVSPAFARRDDTVGDLHHPCAIGRALESRPADDLAARLLDDEKTVTPGDRKSTRLNSSHGYISYAVFCLKKKKKKKDLFFIKKKKKNKKY